MYLSGCKNQIFLRGFIFTDGPISVISPGLIFVVDKICKICIGKNYFFLSVFKTKRSRHENSIYFSTVYLQQILRF